MSDLDDLKNRFDKLRDFNNLKKKEEITDEMLQERLKNLKGLNDNHAVNGPHQNQNLLVPVKFETDAEETDYLFNQLCDETEINMKFEGKSNDLNKDEQIFDTLFASKDKKEDSKNVNGFTCNFNENFVSKSYDRTSKSNKILSEEELEKELGFLKKKMNDFRYRFCKTSASSSNKDQLNFGVQNLNQFDQLTTDSSSSEDEKFASIVEKFVEEVKLDELIGQINNRNTIDYEDHLKMNEFDFCYICNEDAALECKECDDRFCLNCFKEFHRDPEYQGHSYIKFNSR